jgi:hypothetical protein
VAKALLGLALLAGSAVAADNATPDARLEGLGAICLRFEAFPDQWLTAPDAGHDDVRVATGLSAAEWVKIRRQAVDDVRGILQGQRVPFSEAREGVCSDSAKPALVFSVSSSALSVVPAGAYYSVLVELKEPAELLRRPGVRGSVTTWSNSWNGFSEAGTLAFQIGNAIRFWAKSFGDSYSRSNPATHKP